ncbi:MAG: GNAT family N-acetyltransferase [Thermoprotei archaeon]
MQPDQIIETFRTKDGRSVAIRTVGPGDIEGLMNYINGLVDEDAPILTNERQTYLSEIRYVADETQKMLEGNLIGLVAVAEDKIIAHAEIRRGFGRTKHVGTLGIGVIKEYRNAGLGYELIRLLLSLAKAENYGLIKLEVYANNASAIHLYRKLGFIQTGIIPRMGLFKERYVDGLIMCKDL